MNNKANITKWLSNGECYASCFYGLTHWILSVI